MKLIKNALGGMSAIASVLATPFVVYAAEGLKGAGELVQQVGTSAGYDTSPAASSLPVIVGKIISAALGFLGIVLLGYLLYAGFLWMTSGGESEKADQAKTMIKNAIIGLVIIVSSYAISSFVLNKLLGATGAV